MVYSCFERLGTFGRREQLLENKNRRSHSWLKALVDQGRREKVYSRIGNRAIMLQRDLKDYLARWCLSLIQLMIPVNSRPKKKEQWIAL